MRKPTPLTGPVTMSQIAERYRVTGPCVSNWRARHEDFPPPFGACVTCGNAPHPLQFQGEQVEAWGHEHGKNIVTMRVET